MIKKWFKKFSVKKWQTCGGLIVSKEWAKNVSIIEVLGQLGDKNDSWKIRVYNEKMSWLFFNFQDAPDMFVGKKLLENWIKEVQG